MKSINTCIIFFFFFFFFFFLSPYITEHLGVEANGYITLANNFISYYGLITTALDSMAGRFMLISIRKNDYKEANEYYSSVLFGVWMLASILLIPAWMIAQRNPAKFTLLGEIAPKYTFSLSNFLPIPPKGVAHPLD